MTDGNHPGSLTSVTDYDIAFTVLDEWHQAAIDNPDRLHYRYRDASIAAIICIKQALFTLLKS